MIRIASLAVFAALVALITASSAKAQLPVAPPPREVHSDGSRAPAPKPDTPAKGEDPAVVVDRIIKNSKDVGDRLEKTDTGTDTRKKQDKILSDIDALINQQENPPPPQSGQSQNKDQDNKPDKNNDPMKDMNPMHGDMPMDKNMGKGMNQGMPMGGMNNMPPMPMGGSQPPKGNGKNEPDKTGSKSDSKNTDQKPTGGQKEPKGNNPSGKGGGGAKVLPKMSLPFDDEVAKDVWGHLPYKLRQQMSQYYKDDVIPKYAELLRLYYSSLAEKNGNPMMPRK
jgi:hypothetical protein